MKLGFVLYVVTWFLRIRFFYLTLKIMARNLKNSCRRIGSTLLSRYGIQSKMFLAQNNIRPIERWDIVLDSFLSLFSFISREAWSSSFESLILGVESRTFDSFKPMIYSRKWQDKSFDIFISWFQNYKNSFWETFSLT